MSHQCTACGRTFEDGSTAMLSGCPDCGGNTFQYFKGDPPETTGTPPDPELDAGVTGAVGETVGKARAAVSGLVGDRTGGTHDGVGAGKDEPGYGHGSGTGSELADDETATTDDGDDILVADETPVAAQEGTDSKDEIEIEDGDQRNSECVAEKSTATDSPTTASEGKHAETETGTPVGAPATAERPDLDELRAELNEQFESIKILEPGQYELNLMELYEREEYIIALQEDGRYVIDMPETRHAGDE